MPTVGESQIRLALTSHYSDQDFSFVHRDIEDRPDFLCKLNGHLIAIEATQIPPSEILQYYYKIGKDSLDPTIACGSEVIWADEPHIWVAQAIKAKREKILPYKRSSGAMKVYLIVHTPSSETQNYIRIDNEWENQAIRYGASMVGHGFDKVLFWEPRTGLQQIYRKGQKFKRFQFDLSNGYPARVSRQWSSGTITTTSSPDDPPVEYDFGEVQMQRIIIPPNDPEFRKHLPNRSQKGIRMKAVAYHDRIEPTYEFL